MTDNSALYAFQTLMEDTDTVFLQNKIKTSPATKTQIQTRKKDTQ